MTNKQEKNDKLELAITPVGYNDPNFDKFEYFFAIGSWDMAQQLYEDTKQELQKAREDIKLLKHTLKPQEQYTKRNTELVCKLDETYQQLSEKDEALLNAQSQIDVLLLENKLLKGEDLPLGSTFDPLDLETARAIMNYVFQRVDELKAENKAKDKEIAELKARINQINKPIIKNNIVSKLSIVRGIGSLISHIESLGFYKPKKKTKESEEI